MADSAEVVVLSDDEEPQAKTQREQDATDSSSETEEEEEEQQQEMRPAATPPSGQRNIQEELLLSPYDPDDAKASEQRAEHQECAKHEARPWERYFPPPIHNAINVIMKKPSTFVLKSYDSARRDALASLPVQKLLEKQRALGISMSGALEKPELVTHLYDAGASTGTKWLDEVLRIVHELADLSAAIAADDAEHERLRWRLGLCANFWKAAASVDMVRAELCNVSEQIERGNEQIAKYAQASSCLTKLAEHAPEAPAEQVDALNASLARLESDEQTSLEALKRSAKELEQFLGAPQAFADKQGQLDEWARERRSAMAKKLICSARKLPDVLTNFAAKTVTRTAELRNEVERLGAKHEAARGHYEERAMEGLVCQSDEAAASALYKEREQKQSLIRMLEDESGSVRSALEVHLGRSDIWTTIATANPAEAAALHNKLQCVTSTALAPLSAVADYVASRVLPELSQSIDPSKPYVKDAHEAQAPSEPCMKDMHEAPAASDERPAKFSRTSGSWGSTLTNLFGRRPASSSSSSTSSSSCAAAKRLVM